MKTSKELLQEAQERLGLNQKDFGTYIGVSRKTVSNWMTDQRECPMHVAELALRMTEADLALIETTATATGMMRWALISSNGTDEFLHVYGSKADALRDAKIYWDHLTEKEKKHQERFEVGLIHAALTGSGSFSYYEDENGLIDGDVYEIAKDWKE